MSQQTFASPGGRNRFQGVLGQQRQSRIHERHPSFADWTINGLLHHLVDAAVEMAHG